MVGTTPSLSTAPLEKNLKSTNCFSTDVGHHKLDKSGRKLIKAG